MNEIDIIRGPRGQVVKKTRVNHDSIIKLFGSGANLLIDANRSVQAESRLLDHKTQEGSSKLAVWRFLSMLPISLAWCFDTALCGDYGISKNILRLSLEETIKLIYYSEFPEAAHKQVVYSKDTDLVNISDMLKELNIPAKRGFLKLYGNLSNFYCHANFNIPPEIAYEENGNISIGGGSRYLPDTFENIVKQLLQLNANALKYTANRFPVILEDLEFLTKLNNYIQSMIEIKNDSEVTDKS